MSGAPLRIDHRVVFSDGSQRVIHMHARAVRDDSGRATGLSGIAQDVTERKKAEDEIRFLAYHDSLTRLGNRLLFKEHVNRALARSRRHRGLVTLLFVIESVLFGHILAERRKEAEDLERALELGEEEARRLNI